MVITDERVGQYGLWVHPICIGEHSILSDDGGFELVRCQVFRGWSQKAGVSRGVACILSRAAASVGAPTVISILNPPMCTGSTVAKKRTTS